MITNPQPITISTALQLREVVCFHYDGAIIFDVYELAIERRISVNEAACDLDRWLHKARRLHGTDFTCPLKHTKEIMKTSIRQRYELTLTSLDLVS
jgi:hypothetical protein